MKLTGRLKTVADKVPIGSSVADIGTDHGYIPIYLTKNEICKFSIATDVRKGPIEKARKNISIYNLEDKIYLRNGSGLRPIKKGEVDCAIIAGMGGCLICDILEDGKHIADTIENFIIQPMQAIESVAEYLYNNEFKIYDNSLVKENNKIYQVMSVCHGQDYIDDEIYFEIGKKLIENKDPLLEEYVELKRREIIKVISKVQNIDSISAQERLKECRYKLKKYEGVLKCL